MSNYLDLDKWLSNHLNIKDDSGGDADHFETLSIDKYSVKIHQSSRTLLDKISFIENDFTLIYPIVVCNDTWRDDSQVRIRVAETLMAKLSQLKPMAKVAEISSIDNLKFQQRLQALNVILKKAEIQNQKLPKVCHYRVINCTKISILACFYDVLVEIIHGTPFILRTDLYSTIPVALLREMFIESGGPASVFGHLIDFKITNQGQIGTYILTETADIHSALDNLFDVYIVSNLSCIKVFAQESLRSTIETIIRQKLKNQYVNNSLFAENEPFSINSKAFLNFDAICVDYHDQGIGFHYYRFADESINMINRFKGSSFVSIWSSEDIGIGHKIARQIQTTRNVSINCCPLNLQKLLQSWSLELLPHESYHRYAQATKSKVMLNKSWSTLKNRSQLLMESLDAVPYDGSIKIELLRFNIECYSTSRGLNHSFQEYEDYVAASLIQLNYKMPLGNIIIHLDKKNESIEEYVSTLNMLSIFCFNLLLDGNVLTLIAPTNTLNDWQPIVLHFNSNPLTKGILQTIEYDEKNDTSGLTKWWSEIVNEKCQDGLLLLLDDKKRIESLFINQKRFFANNKDGWKWLIKWIRCRYQCSITVALQEYNMSKMVT
ncbi:uncharacterized protein LOC113793556 [Dermatophagoides pteronyssinus]|uniref:uncharacterized protein LOC113793556 n=1 Tax=Dermatophagoides pteronyssinus TaxID=6956 RepID=UPI003F67643E